MLEKTWLVLCLIPACMFSSILKMFGGGKAKGIAKSQSPFAAAPARAMENPTESDHGVQSAGQPRQESSEFAQAKFSTSNEVISLPLSLVIKQLPRELIGNVAMVGSVSGCIDLPREKVVEQLKNGAVKISFGEIRQLAPDGAFIKSGSHDTAQVDLPLKPIIEQLSAEEFPRRTDQQLVVVPEELRDLFGPNGERLTDVRIIKKSDLRPATDAQTNHPAGASPFRKQAVVPSAESPTLQAPQLATATSIPSEYNAFATSAGSASMPPTEKPGVIAISDTLKNVMLQGGNSAASTAAPIQKTAKSSAATSRNATTPRSPGGLGNAVQVPLAALSAGWPESIKKEIEEFELGGLSCQFVLEDLKNDLRAGKVAYNWGQIREWLNPLPPDLPDTSNADVVVTLPLKVLAPVFIQNISAPKQTSQPATQDVPNVFQGQTKPLVTRSKPPGAVAESNPTLASNAPSPTRGSGGSTIKAPSKTAAKGTVAHKRGVSSSPALVVPLKTVCANWAEPILNFIVENKLDGANLAIPLSILEKDLKTGKLTYDWYKVSSWINQMPEEADLGDLGSEVVELPLSVIAPLYLQQRSGKDNKKSYVPKDIPDLFSAEGVPLAPPPANFPEADAVTQAPAPQELDVDQVLSADRETGQEVEQMEDVPAKEPKAKPQEEAAKPPANLSELFGEPKKKNWTPNEIVHRSSQLPGVQGALIALQDGLLVASCLPPGWKTETVSAFLPQIFGRMRQYTRELAIGELNSLTLYVEKGPLQIFNAGLIYYLVLGQNETPMPMQELNLIANELSRHTK